MQPNVFISDLGALRHCCDSLAALEGDRLTRRSNHANDVFMNWQAWIDIAAQKRRPDELAKRGKDSLQAKALIEALTETDPLRCRTPSKMRLLRV